MTQDLHARHPEHAACRPRLESRRGLREASDATHSLRCKSCNEPAPANGSSGDRNAVTPRDPDDVACARDDRNQTRRRRPIQWQPPGLVEIPGGGALHSWFLDCDPSVPHNWAEGYCSSVDQQPYDFTKIVAQYGG